MRLGKGKSGMHVQKYPNQEIVRPSTWMWIHFTLRLVSNGMKRSGIRNRREVVESKFLCSMIPCLSIVDCMHQGDDVNVVIVLELEQNGFFYLLSPEDNRRTLA